LKNFSSKILEKEIKIRFFFKKPTIRPSGKAAGTFFFRQTERTPSFLTQKVKNFLKFFKIDKGFDLSKKDLFGKKPRKQLKILFFFFGPKGKWSFLLCKFMKRFENSFHFFARRDATILSNFPQNPNKFLKKMFGVAENSLFFAQKTKKYFFFFFFFKKNRAQRLFFLQAAGPN